MCADSDSETKMVIFMHTPKFGDYKIYGKECRQSFLPGWTVISI